MSDAEEDDATWLVGPISHAVLAAVDGRFDDVVEIIDHIGSRGGPPAMFSACCAWAESIGRMDGTRAGVEAGGFVEVTVDPSLDVEGDAKNRARLFAVRFVAAVMNGDHDMAAALFTAPIEANDPKGHAACIMALIGLVGSTGRERLARRDAKLSRRRPTVQRPPRQQGRRS